MSPSDKNIEEFREEFGWTLSGPPGYHGPPGRPNTEDNPFVSI